MEQNVILAGVGGQGILTMAQVISRTATRLGRHVKQSEVHGMSQRGGAVQAHVRISDLPIYSDLIPHGAADVILALEPLEALRYVQYLHPQGAVVASVVPLVNIFNYPPIEELLDRISDRPHSILVDADRLARAAGSARSSNMALLGAGSVLLKIDQAEWLATIAEMFPDRGAAEANQKAFRFGAAAAARYLEAARGGTPARALREWLASVPPAELARAHPPQAEPRSREPEALSDAEQQGVIQTLEHVRSQGRERLHEHEVYALVELVGAIPPPRHRFIAAGHTVGAQTLAELPGDRVVLKLVSPDVVHKSDVEAVVFAPKNELAVNREMARLIERHTGHGYRVEGVLLVEYVDHTRSFGSELFVGLRSTREFGPVIAAGLGGLETEYLASKLRPGSAAAKALATETSAERFFELFRNTAAYEVLSGQVRGHRRVVADDALLRCFRAFIAIARRFCVAGGPSPAGIVELEVNPFAFVDGRIIPLDGRGRLGLLTKPAAPRPLHNMSALLEPQAIAVAGVSGSRRNFGRIILDNIKASGFPVQRLYAIKDQAEPIDGVRCVRDVADLPEVADLLVAATAADRVPALIEQVVNHQKARSVILIPGGLGEVQGTRVLGDRIRDLILASRSQPGGGPLVLGGNSLGVRSHPGRYDTFFITEEKLGPRPLAPCRLALVSQSGGFMISRMSNLAHLEPRIAVSVGNQIDLTLSDVLRGVGGREDVDCVGVYVEGFNDLDGLDFVRAVRQLTSQGKLIVFYKAGRTPPGKSATRGHTASIAGDYDVCQAAVAEAGALVTDTFKEFEQLLELGACLHGKRVGGRRLAAISNGGFESVGMADAILGARYQLEMAQLSDPTKALLQEALTACGLHSLVTAGNPLDLTPMADDEAYENCIRAMLQAQEVDALVVSCVPMTTQLLTLPDEIERTGSIAARLPHLAQWSDKPLVFVVDCGEPFEALARRVRQAGVPVFRSCDQAVRSLGRYLCHRSAGQSGEDTPSAVARADADSGRGRQAHALSKCAAAARR